MAGGFRDLLQPESAWFNTFLNDLGVIAAMTVIDAELDASGLNCPLPILKAKKALAGLQGGQTLRVIATDPDSIKDFETFSRQMGHALLEARGEDGRFYFLLRKREG